MNSSTATQPMRVASVSPQPRQQQQKKGPRQHGQPIWPRHRADLPDEPTLVQLAINKFFGQPHPDTNNQWKAGHPYVGICQDSQNHRAGKIIFFRPSEFKESVEAGVLRAGLFMPVQLVKEFASIGEGTRYKHHVQVDLPDGSKRWMSCFLREELYDVPSLHLATQVLARNVKRADRELAEQARNEHLTAKAAAEELRLKREFGLTFDEKEAIVVNAAVAARYDDQRLADEVIAGTTLTKMVLEFKRKDGQPLDEDDCRLIRQHLGNPRSELLEVRDRRLFILAPVASLPPEPEQVVEEVKPAVEAEAPKKEKVPAPEPVSFSPLAMQVIELIHAEGMNTSESLIQKRLRLSDEDRIAVLDELVARGVLGSECYPGGDFREIKDLPSVPNPVAV